MYKVGLIKTSSVNTSNPFTSAIDTTTSSDKNEMFHERFIQTLFTNPSPSPADIFTLTTPAVETIAPQFNTDIYRSTPLTTAVNVLYEYGETFLIPIEVSVDLEYTGATKTTLESMTQFRSSEEGRRNLGLFTRSQTMGEKMISGAFATSRATGATGNITNTHRAK